MKKSARILTLSSVVMLTACTPEFSDPASLSRSGAFSSVTQKSEPHIRAQSAKAQWPRVQFHIDLPQAFRIQRQAEASYARLEIYNKYNMAAFNRQYQLNFGDPEYMDPTLPLLASNANEAGYVPVSGDIFVIGAQVPPGPNWLVKLKLYSNPSPEGLIQELSAGFHLNGENNAPVQINAQSHLLGWALNTLQGINPVVEIDGLGRSYIGTVPIDLEALQHFMDGFMGLPENTTVARTESNPQLPSNDNVRAQINTGPLEYPHLQALNEAPPPVNGVPQAAPPALTLDDLDRFAVGEMLVERLLQNQPLNYAAGLSLWDSNRWRKPGYLVDHALMQQRDSVGGMHAFNPDTGKAFTVNNAVINDIQETLHGLQLSDQGGIVIDFARQDLERIDSRFVSLGQNANGEEAIYLMSRVNSSALGEGADRQPGRALQRDHTKQPVSLMAISQNGGETLWQFTSWEADTDDPLACDCSNNAPNVLSDPVHFTPVVDRQPNGDSIYTVLHSQGGNNSSIRGVYKIKSQNPPLKQGYYKHDTKDDFTHSGALSSDGTRLYLSTKAKLGDPSQLLVLNTTDMSLINQYRLPEGELFEISSSPVLGRDGRVYVNAFSSTRDGSRGIVYAFDTEGQLLWRYELPELQASQFGEYNDTLGQVLYPPVLLNPPGQDPTLFCVTASGTIFSITDTGSSASLNWSHSIGARVFETPTLVENQDGSLELYTASDTRIGRVFGLDALTGERLWSLFPSGFFSTGFVIDRGFTYLTTRSGNYGDFTKYRSLKTEGWRVAPPAISSWPKLGGDLANSGKPQK